MGRECERVDCLGGHRPGARQLVLDLDGAQPPMDGVHEPGAAPGRAAAVDRGVDDVLGAGQVGRPVQLELLRHLLSIGTGVPGQQKSKLKVLLIGHGFAAVSSMQGFVACQYK